MRHADGDALDRLEVLLERIRAVDGLVERTRGVFYRRSRAFLHFHVDPTGLYADVRPDTDFVRVRVDTPSEQDHLLGIVTSAQS